MISLSGFKNKTYESIPDTLIGKGITLKLGMLSGVESVRIDGVLKGDVDLENELIIGESGIVYGNIKAQYITIAGKVIGNMYSDNTIYLTSTSNVNGIIVSSNLIVEDGAVVNGKLNIGKYR